MKYFAVFVLLSALAFPVFAQNTALTQRFNALSESMGTTVTKATSTLADFDSQIKEKGDTNVYVTYLRKHDYLVEALDESEGRFKLLIRTNDRNVRLGAERDTYESLLKQLQSVKSDFDNYVKSR